jgi:hypothetical protein
VRGDLPDPSAARGLSACCARYNLPMATESAKYRRERIEQVAGLTKRLQALEELLANEADEGKRRGYEKARSDLMQMLREIGRK